MDRRDFYLNTKGWAFSGEIGLKARINAVKDEILTQNQAEELSAMKTALFEIVKNKR